MLVHIVELDKQELCMIDQLLFSFCGLWLNLHNLYELHVKEPAMCPHQKTKPSAHNPSIHLLTIHQPAHRSSTHSSIIHSTTHPAFHHAKQLGNHVWKLSTLQCQRVHLTGGSRAMSTWIDNPHKCLFRAIRAGTLRWYVHLSVCQSVDWSVYQSLRLCDRLCHHWPSPWSTFYSETSWR